jgi:hypothetical protein
MIHKSVIQFERTNYKDETEKHSVVCAKLAWQALLPFMGGDWKIIREWRDDTETSVKRCYSVCVERSDRLRLSVSGSDSHRYGAKPNTITVSPGYYEDTQGCKVELSYTEPRGAIGSTTLDVTKREAKTLAKVINSKIVAPLEAKLPKIVERLDQSAKAQDSFAATCQAFRDAGGTCRENGKSEAYATLRGVSFRVGHGGSCRIEATSMSFQQAVKVAKVLGDKD